MLELQFDGEPLALSPRDEVTFWVGVSPSLETNTRLEPSQVTSPQASRPHRLFVRTELHLVAMRERLHFYACQMNKS